MDGQILPMLYSRVLKKILIKIASICIGGTVKKRMQIRFSYRPVSQSKKWKIRGNLRHSCYVLGK